MKCIAVMMLTLCAGVASATSYYVSSSSGNDANGGTVSAPWQTIAHVNGHTFLPGDSILFKRGDVWNESLTPTSSGSSGNPIAYDAYGTGAAPNLTGYYAVPTNAWVLVSGNAWKAALPATYSSVNFCLFGSVWGQKVAAATSNLTQRGNFYLANGFIYIFSTGNPGTFYNEAIVPMALSNVPVINVSGTSWLTFQHFLLNWFDEYGVYVQGNSDHLVFANMEADSMIPQGTQPLGFYVDESAPGPGDIKIYNAEAHLNYDGFRFDGAATSITMVNDKAYANRDGALVDNTGAVTYSHCHFYASSLAVAGSTDVEWTVGTGPIAGAGNVAADVAPAVQVYQRYPADITLTVDDEGMTPGADTYYASTVLPIADAAGVPVGAAITVGYPLAQTLVSEIQGWVNAGRDVSSHSISHTYYTNVDALEVQYTGSGSAASLSISNKTLTITVTGAPGDGVTYNLGQGQAEGTIKALRLALIATGKFTATEVQTCQGPYGTGCSAYTESALLGQDLADVSGVDVKTAIYHMQLDLTRLTTDEITLSRTWMTTNLTGLPATPVYVYPGGYETTTMQGITAAVPYAGGRGALKEDLGVKDTYADGFNVQNITSFGVNPSWQGLQPAVLNQKIQALVWKEAVWGVPWGIFWHLNELSATEVTNLIQDLKNSGAIVRTNTGLVNWLLTGTQEAGTDGNSYYTSPATSTTLDFRPTKSSPVVDAGQNLGAAYALDINGVNQNSYGSGWEIGAHVFEGSSVYGAGQSGSYFKVGGITCGVQAGSCLAAQLPLNWVNSEEWKGTTTNTINFPSTGTGGSWSCGSTGYGPYAAGNQASAQQAVNDAESCRTANGSGTTIVFPAGSTYSGSAGLSLPQTAGDTSSAFIVLTSSTPLTSGQTACSHGIQDNVAESTQPGIRNLGCNGTSLSYQLGSTVTSISAGGFTLANGMVTSTSNYNDIGSMYTIEATGSNVDAISTAVADANGAAPHHFAILNAELLIAPGLSCCAPVKIGQGTETATSQLPTHIHFAYDYVHADWGDAPVSGGVATGPPVGTTLIPADWNFAGCTNCSVMYSYVDKSLRPPSEGHVILNILAQQMKFAHNWLEGMSSSIFCGGFSTVISITIPANYQPCTDMEDRANRFTYPYSWLLAKNAGYQPSQGSYVRKNGHEMKVANRYLFDGNIVENVDNSGAQSGTVLSVKTDNTSGGPTGTNYWLETQNVTTTNSIFRNACNGPTIGSRSALGGGNGGGITLPAQIFNYSNNLMYNISVSNPGCGGLGGSGPQYGFRVGGSAVNTWTATASRDVTGTIATLTLTSQPGGTQSDMNVGDPVAVGGCVDSTFDTNFAALGPAALAGTSPTSLTVVYANSGSASATTTGCTFYNYQGWTNGILFTHNTDVVNGGSSSPTDPYNSNNGGTNPYPQIRNLSFTNSIFVGGGETSEYAEGTRTSTQAFNSSTLTFNNLLMAGRDSQVQCPAHQTAGPGGSVCYTEYGGANGGASPPVTVYLSPAGNCTGSDPTSGNCAGILGAMSQSLFPYDLADWNQYRLCHASDVACSSKSSLYAAGAVSQAADGADLGMNPAGINNAQTRSLYVCSTLCGLGPYPD